MNTNQESNILENTTDAIQQTFENAHQNEENALERAKETFNSKLLISTPAGSISASQVSVYELKSRLNWGEPGLTILDVRDRKAFNDCRILGAMNTPLSILPEAVQSTLQQKRDIYVYGSSEEEATTAANSLREAGFHKVAVLQGGLEAWLKVDGSVDGVATNVEPSPGAYNLVSRLKEFANERAQEKNLR
jgi:rhodanese-related sulfurtransferase